MEILLKEYDDNDYNIFKVQYNYIKDYILANIKLLENI